MYNFKKIFTHKFLLTDGYVNMFNNFIVSIFKPLLIFTKLIFKLLHLLLQPLVPVKNKNAKKEQERLDRKKKMETNFVRISKY